MPRSWKKLEKRWCLPLARWPRYFILNGSDFESYWFKFTRKNLRKKEIVIDCHPLARAVNSWKPFDTLSDPFVCTSLAFIWHALPSTHFYTILIFCCIGFTCINVYSSVPFRATFWPKYNENIFFSDPIHFYLNLMKKLIHDFEYCSWILVRMFKPNLLLPFIKSSFDGPLIN